MPKQQLDAMMGEYGAFTEGIRKSGQYIGGEPLQPTQTATTVRVPAGENLHDRRSIRRDQGTAWWLLPDQRDRLERSYPGSLSHSLGADRID